MGNFDMFLLVFSASCGVAYIAYHLSGIQSHLREIDNSFKNLNRMLSEIAKSIKKD